MKNNRGFTLIELMITIAIGSVIFGFTTFGVIRQRVVQNLDSDAKRVESFLRDAQQRSITQENGSMWGVRLEKLVTGDIMKLVYASSSTLTSTIYPPPGSAAPAALVREVYKLKNDIYWVGLVDRSIQDIAFSTLKGSPGGTPQSVVLGIISGAETKTITISANGTITLAQ
ncbi:MAG: type II secretion system protein [Patescibacteria group bacterium]